MARHSYVQCPKTHKLIPKHEYVAPRERTHLIMPDIDPFVSVVDGNIIGSRSHIAEHNRRNNVESVGDLKYKDYVKMAQDKHLEMTGQTSRQRRERIEDIKHAIEIHRQR